VGLSLTRFRDDRSGPYPERIDAAHLSRDGATAQGFWSSSRRGTTKRPNLAGDHELLKSMLAAPPSNRLR
jgi:hypothetical protein